MLIDLDRIEDDIAKGDIVQYDNNQICMIAYDCYAEEYLLINLNDGNVVNTCENINSFKIRCVLVAKKNEIKLSRI